MSGSALHATPVNQLVTTCVDIAKSLAKETETPRVVISPYRFNPLGAHIDHQNGAVLARCLDQYTILCFWPSCDASSTVQAQLPPCDWQSATFSAGELDDDYGWDAMARASATAFSAFAPVDRGINAVVFGTLPSGGLSSSASVILAYLSALADVNGMSLNEKQLVELSRQVENDYRGLNNGIQDQMSIAFGCQNHLSKLVVETVEAQLIPDPQNIADVCFLMCYSGISRNLAGSSFNTRVEECIEAAQALFPSAEHLGQVPPELRSEQARSQLPALQARRARHVYTEMERVEQGVDAWSRGEWSRFGELMNASCQSSIHDYESGSEWLIALHQLASDIPGVLGNRFSGGGYGGCLFMLVDAGQKEQIATELLERYLAQYPRLQGLACVQLAKSEGTVRVVSP